MTTPQEQIQQEIKTALKAGEKDRLSTLRLLLSTIKNERIRIGAEIDEPTFLTIVRKAIKQRQESAEQYTAGARQELADKELSEATILAGFLPPEVDPEELRSAVQEFVAAQGLAGPAALGPIMKEMLARFAGRTDGATLNRVARDVLSLGG